MSRPLRLEFPGAVYHVMNRGLARQAIFRDDIDRKQFLKLLADVHSRWNLKIFAYCLMSNHYHLSVQTPSTALSRIMRHINGVYTQKYNQRYKTDGPLFRGRYKAILVEKDPYLLAVVRYIHQNSSEAETCRWSSARYYLADSGRPYWLDTGPVLDFFGGDRNKFKQFMDVNGPDNGNNKPYQPESHGPLFGSENFKERIRLEQDHRIDGPEMPERRYLAVPMKTCIAAVSSVYGTKEGEIIKSIRGVRNEPRQVAMYICREAGGYRHREIAVALSSGSYSTVSSACASLKKRMKKEKELREKVMMIYRHVVGEKE